MAKVSSTRRSIYRRTRSTTTSTTTEPGATTESNEIAAGASSVDQGARTPRPPRQRGSTRFEPKDRRQTEAGHRFAGARRRPSSTTAIDATSSTEAAPAPTSTGAARARPTRTFARRRYTKPVAPAGGDNNATSNSSGGAGRRPFRVGVRRRDPPAPASAVKDTSQTLGEQTQGLALGREKSEDSSSQRFINTSPIPKNERKTVKIQRRPLTSDVSKPYSISQSTESYANNFDNKRDSKKFSAAISQNELEDLLKRSQETKSQEEKSQESQNNVESTDKNIDNEKTISLEEFNPETALALAVHQIVSAPVPTTNKEREDPTDPIYTTSINHRETTPRTFLSTTESGSSRTTTTSDLINNFIASALSSNIGFRSTTPKSFGSTLIGFDSIGFTGRSIPGYSTNTDYNSPTIENFDSTNGGFEPVHFTREYLMESPVTRTYDPDYRFFTTPAPTTTPKPKPAFRPFRKISTTVAPAPKPFSYDRPLTRKQSDRKVKAYESINQPTVTRTYRPVVDYEYYDDGDEKLSDKYLHSGKVLIHSKGIIECLDQGNFPHPSSCKKFITCARMVNGHFYGSEYTCPRGLSFDPIGGICNWAAGLGCNET